VFGRSSVSAKKRPQIWVLKPNCLGFKITSRRVRCS
jgi:hypothetical protein